MSSAAFSRSILIVVSTLSLIPAAGWGLTVRAQHLPIRHYGVAEGLPNGTISSIYQDFRGYVWFATWEGLSRFDGHRFTNYDVRHGLGHLIINDIVEDRRGRLWVATNGGGIARLVEPPIEMRSSETCTASSPSLFVSYRIGPNVLSNRVNKLLFDSQNNLWCLTNGGLYRCPADALEHPRFERISERKPDGFLPRAALADRWGRLWFGVGHGLLRLDSDGMITYGAENPVGEREVVSIIEHPSGRLLVAQPDAVFQYVEATDGLAAGSWEPLPIELHPGQVIQAMIAEPDGTLWIGTNKGLIRYRPGDQQLYTVAHGLPSDDIWSLCWTREGILWGGTSGNGVFRLSPEQIINFTQSDGLPNVSVQKILQERSGRILLSTLGGLAEIQNDRARPIRGFQKPPFDQIRRRITQDGHGHWWIGTEEGLYYFPGPELRVADGERLLSVEVSTIYRAPDGDVLVGLMDGTVYRFQNSDGRPRGWPVNLAGAPRAPVIVMLVDRSGALWLGWHEYFGRWRNGRFQLFRTTEGLPETRPRVLFQDSRGWLWIGLRYRGVSVTRDPTAAHPRFVNYSIEDGLLGHAVGAIAEDEFGRIYLGTARGLNRFDPRTNRMECLTVNDGLVSDQVRYCFKDARGTMWIGTAAGLSKLRPRAETMTALPPPIYLTRVQVAGEDLLLLPRGARRLPALTLSAGQNHLRIEYAAVWFQGGLALRYQYKLEGVDRDWSPLSEEQSVTYPRLAPGPYRFLVRAVAPDGTVSAQPAECSFRILRPLWQRWWFVALVFMTLIGAGYGLHRYRVRQVLQLERIRTRIATDLHDDIGASLSEIALLSEVLKQRVASSVPEAGDALAQIADRARQLIGVMGDIVWSIDPQRDALQDVIFRIHALASDLLEASGVGCYIELPPHPERIKLSFEQRHHLYLIVKEAVHNILRHAACRSVWIRIWTGDHRLWLEIRDDGRGFDLRRIQNEERSGGNGLGNMQKRAAELGGQLDIMSIPGQGTRIRLTMPLD